MNVLVINPGTSNLKFSIHDTERDAELLKGDLRDIGQPQTLFRLRPLGGEMTTQEALKPMVMRDAVNFVAKLFKDIHMPPLDAVVYRMAHGGQHRQPLILTNDNIAELEKLNALAPMHNPPTLMAIEKFTKLIPDVPHIAVFDTAFHHTMPAHARTYAVPKAWRDAGIDRFGFHGPSHQYVSLRASQFLKTTPHQLRIISCHVGNGASVCAIERGQSIDVTLGMTPLEGLVMGTRCGDIDPGLVFFVHRQLGIPFKDIEKALYNDSGLKALSGISNDYIEIEKAAAAGNRDAQLALQVFAYRIRKAIGAYAAVMDGVDVITMTGGICENSISMRQRILHGFEFLGVHLNYDANMSARVDNNQVIPIHASNSRTQVLVMETREQWMFALIARDVLTKAKQQQTRGSLIIPVAISARHVHLSKESLEALFGAGAELHEDTPLKQKGHYAAKEKVTLVGPKGEIKDVRVLGPLRKETQIEVSKTDTFKLGARAPVRMSGDLSGTPTITLVGPKGSYVSTGLIIAQRHIHMDPAVAEANHLQDNDEVLVQVTGGERDITFSRVTVRLHKGATTEMHIDTDEGNAAGIAGETTADLNEPGLHARIITRDSLHHLLTQFDKENEDAA